MRHPCDDIKVVKWSVLSVCCLSLAQKSSDLDISASEQTVSTTKLSEKVKNLHVFDSNRIILLTGKLKNMLISFGLIKKKHIETGNNPLVLSYFHGTHSKYKDAKSTFELGIKSTRQLARSIVQDLLTSMEKRLFRDSFDRCLQWLMYAAHGSSIDYSLLEAYKQSYLHVEHITSCSENRK